MFSSRSFVILKAAVFSINTLYFAKKDHLQVLIPFGCNHVLPPLFLEVILDIKYLLAFFTHNMNIKVRGFSYLNGGSGDTNQQQNFGRQSSGGSNGLVKSNSSGGGGSTGKLGDFIRSDLS